MKRMMVRRAFVGLCALIGLLAPTWAGQAAALEELEVVPASLTLPTEGEVRALVLLRNTMTATLTGVRLSQFTDAGVTVEAEPPAVATVGPQGTLVWTLRVKRASEGLPKGTIHLRVDYTRKEKGEDKEEKEIPGVALGSLAVAPRPPAAAAEVVKVEVKTSLTQLLTDRPGVAYVVVTNVSDVDVRIAAIEPITPESIQITPLPSKRPGPAGPRAPLASVAPRGVHAFPYRVEATKKVRPAKHTVLFHLALEWEKEGRPRSGSAIATQELDVGVLGESEILKTLELPSLLLVPGFLILLAVRLTFRLALPKFPFPLEAKSANFWAIAILLSLAIGLAYPYYRRGYGFEEVAWVWILSLLVPAALTLIGIGAWELYGRAVASRAKREQRERTPTASDEAIPLLRRLDKQNLSTCLERVDVNIAGQQRRAYLLQERVPEQQKIWVGPGIMVEWLKGAPPEFRQQVGEQLVGRGSPLLLADLLEQGQKKGLLRVQWQKEPGFDGPREVNVADLSGSHTRNPIVVEN